MDGLIDLDGRAPSKRGFFERRRLVKALALLAQAARVEPPLGAGSFMAAKAEGRLAHLEDSLQRLRTARTEAPGNVIGDIELSAAISRRGSTATLCTSSSCEVGRSRGSA